MRLKIGDKVALIRRGKVIMISRVTSENDHFIFVGDIRFWKDGQPVKWRDTIKARAATQGHIDAYQRRLENRQRVRMAKQ